MASPPGAPRGLALSRPFILYALATANGSAPLEVSSSPGPVAGAGPWPRLFGPHDLELELCRLLAEGGCDAVAVLGPVRNGGAFSWGVVDEGAPGEVLLRLPERLALGAARLSVDVAAEALEGPEGDTLFAELDDADEGDGD